MTCIHDSKVNNIAEWNLLYYITNYPKTTKKLNSHEYHILHECINTRKGTAKFNELWILLYTGCSSTIVMQRLVENLHPKKDAAMQWHTQYSNITTNLRIEVDFTLL